VDPRGHVTRFDYDLYGRLASTVQVVAVADPSSDLRLLAAREVHTLMFTRDALGTVILERLFERVGRGQYRLLSRTGSTYDERGRAIRIVRDLFDVPVSATSLHDFENVAPLGSIPIETWQFYNRNGAVRERREGVIVGGPAAFQGSSTVFGY